MWLVRSDQQWHVALVVRWCCGVVAYIAYPGGLAWSAGMNTATGVLGTVGGVGGMVRMRGV